MHLAKNVLGHASSTEIDLGQLSVLFLFANLASAEPADTARARSAVAADRPSSAVAISTDERGAVQQYRRCVLAAANGDLPSTAKPDDALRALYSCPELRSNIQQLLVAKYGFSHKQKLFNALDQRLLQEVRAVIGVVPVP